MEIVICQRLQNPLGNAKVWLMAPMLLLNSETRGTLDREASCMFPVKQGWDGANSIDGVGPHKGSIA